MPAAFSQLDPRWAGQRLGASALTIGESGCLLTTAASILADWQVTGDPGDLNAWLLAHDGYVDRSRLAFGALPQLGVQLRAWQDYYRNPANLARIAKALAAGWGVLALVDAKPGCAIQAHWLRIVAIQRRDCLVLDPWQRPGAEAGSLLGFYGSPGWDAARSIFIYAALERCVAPVRQLRSLARREQDELCWRAASVTG